MMILKISIHTPIGFFNYRDAHGTFRPDISRARGAKFDGAAVSF